MSQSSARLTLPFIQAAQAQKHVTHNEAVRALDMLVQLSFEDDAQTAPPASPSEGQCYVIPNGASGDWIGQDGAIAAFLDGLWQFHTPRIGWRGYVVARAVMVVFDGTDWQELTPSQIQSANLFGLGMNADPSVPLVFFHSGLLPCAARGARGQLGN